MKTREDCEVVGIAARSRSLALPLAVMESSQRGGLVEVAELVDFLN